MSPSADDELRRARGTSVAQREEAHQGEIAAQIQRIFQMAEQEEFEDGVESDLTTRLLATVTRR
jgi:hypothetical protein